MPASKTTYILVVDDNQTNQTLYERVIRNVPTCEPKCFSKPDDALAWARAHAPALAVVDYRMPGMDGLTFIRELRALPERNAVPCIVLTGVKNEELRKEALRLGVVDFLVKPVDVERLTAHLRNAAR